MDKLKLLVQLATDAEQIDLALTSVGGYKSYEAKRAYLEAWTGSAIVHRFGGDDAEDFWALAQAIVDHPDMLKP